MTAPARGRPLLEAAVLALLLAAAAVLPAARPLPLDVCMLHRLTGLPCLTCGLTRSVCLLVQGQSWASFTFHPAGGLVVLLIALRASWRASEAALGRALAPKALGGLTRALGAAGAVLSLGAWIVRLAQV